MSRLHTALAVIAVIATPVWWASQNIVLARDFSQYQQDQKVRWALYDERLLYREYRDAVQGQSSADKDRALELSHDLQLQRDKIRDLRRSQ